MQNYCRNNRHCIIFIYFIHKANSRGTIILLGFLLVCIHLSLQQRNRHISQMRRFTYSRAEYQTTVNLHLHFGISLCSLHQSETLKLGKKSEKVNSLEFVKWMLLLNSHLYLSGEGLFSDSVFLSCYILLHQYRMDFICAEIDGLPLRYLPM